MNNYEQKHGTPWEFVENYNRWPIEFNHRSICYDVRGINCFGVRSLAEAHDVINRYNKRMEGRWLEMDQRRKEN